MALSMDPESPTQELARLRRELWHVGEQCRRVFYCDHGPRADKMPLFHVIQLIS